MPSQPPDPYLRQFSFTGWNITHPGEPHQGDKIDLELDEIKQSLDETQARLAEIQRDDGFIRPEKLSSSLTQIIGESAAAAATAVYATNLAQLSDKALARSNLQLPSHYGLLDGTNVAGWGELSFSQNPFIGFSLTVVNTGDAGGGYFKQGGQPIQNYQYFQPLGSYSSRTFRAATVAGSLYDYGTWDRNRAGGPPEIPSILPRIDSICASINVAGTMPMCRPGTPFTQNEFGGGFQSWPPFLNWASIYFTQDYTQIVNLPSLFNPLASVGQVVDAMVTHEERFNHNYIPDQDTWNRIGALTSDMIAALQGATTASYSNPFATLADISASGSLTGDQVAAITNADAPSAYNPLVSNSALVAEIGVVNGTLYNEVNSLTSAISNARPVFDNGFLIFTAQDNQQYKVAAELVT